MSEIEAKTVSTSDLHRLVTSMYDVQHMRIIIGNRFHGTEENNLLAFLEKMRELEQNVKLLIKGEVQRYPIHEWIISQRGLSYDYAGQLIGMIQDIGRFSNISKLWSYFGLAVIDICEDCGKQHYPPAQRGEKILNISKRLMEQHEKKIITEGKSDFAAKAQEMVCTCKHPNIKKSTQRRRAGMLLNYNPTAKSLAWKIGAQFVKQGDFYRQLYDQYRTEYELRKDLIAEQTQKAGKKTKNGTSKGTAHIHNMAQRRMVKVFLANLWTEWRKLEGLSVTEPYAIAMLGHADYVKPDKI